MDLLLGFLGLRAYFYSIKINQLLLLPLAQMVNFSLK